jgi:hypothetical protein
VDVMITAMMKDDSVGIIAVRIKARTKPNDAAFDNFQELVAFAARHELGDTKILGIVMELGKGHVEPHVKWMSLDNETNLNVVTLCVAGCTSDIYPIVACEVKLRKAGMIKSTIRFPLEGTDSDDSE